MGMDYYPHTFLGVDITDQLFGTLVAAKFYTHLEVT